MYITVVIGGILLIVALIGVAMWCCYRAGWDNGYDQAQGDQKEATQSERVRGRHARTQPRTSLVKPRAILPIPGPSKPQPGRDSGDGTLTFGKIPEGTSVTGPIAKLVADNEEWMAQRAVEDEIFRLGLALD